MSIDPTTMPISYHAYERAAERFGVDTSDDEWLLTADWMIRDKMKRCTRQQPKLRLTPGNRASRTYKSGPYRFVVGDDGSLITITKSDKKQR